MVSFPLVALCLLLCQCLFLCITKDSAELFQLCLLIDVCVTATIKGLHTKAIRIIAIFVCVQHVGFIKNCHLQKEGFRCLASERVTNGLAINIILFFLFG